MMEDREYGDMDVPNYMRGASKGFTTHFYINGDEHYQSKSLLVNPKRYRNFDTFLDDATRSLNPRFGAIRNVYTPLGKHKISSFDDLKEDGQYVAAGVERYKNIGKPYTAIEGHSPRPSKINKTNFNNRIEPVFHSKIRQDARFRQSQSFASKAKRITVAINNDEIDHPHVILIPAKKANDLPSIIETVAKDLEERGVHHRVEYLVDTDSEVVCTNADDIIEDHIYVACNKASRYKHKTYTRDGRKNFVVIPSPRPLQRPKFIWESSNVNGSRENKRPRTLPPIGSKNYKGSPDNSVASNPEYRRKPNQANGAIHTKPQKHKRTPEKKPKQTDYDKDDGGVFKAKDTNKHTKGAKEVGETKDTRTDLPIDQVPAEEVKDEKIKSQRTPKETTQKTNSKTNNNNNNNKSNTNQKTADHSHGSKDPNPKKHSGTRGEFNNVSPLPDIGQQNRSSTPVGRNGQMSPTQKEKDQAAAKIQANYRGHKTRQELAKQKEDANKKDALNKPADTKKDEKKPDQKPKADTTKKEMKEDEAATKIQAGFRGHKTRQDLKKQQGNQQDDKANAQQDQKQQNAPPAQNKPPAPTQSDQIAPKGDNANKKPESNAQKGDKPPSTADSSKAPANQKTDSSAQKGDKPPNTADSNKPATQKTDDSPPKGDKPPNTADSNKPPAAAGQTDQSVPQGGNTGPTAGGDKTN